VNGKSEEENEEEEEEEEKRKDTRKEKRRKILGHITSFTRHYCVVRTEHGRSR
jgi:cell division protein FtsB